MTLGRLTKLSKRFEASLHRIRCTVLVVVVFALARALAGAALAAVLSHLGVALRDRLGALTRAHHFAFGPARVFVSRYDRPGRYGFCSCSDRPRRPGRTGLP